MPSLLLIPEELLVNKEVHVLTATFPTNIILSVLIYTKMEEKKSHINSATPHSALKQLLLVHCWCTVAVHAYFADPTPI